MIFHFVVALCAIATVFSTAPSSEYKGDHYDGASGYTPDLWNYDMTHKYFNAAQCKNAAGNPFTCSANNKCGPDCWRTASTANKCSGSSQTPINLISPTIDNTLSLPEFLVTDGGCEKWVQFADDHAFEVSFSETGHDCSNLKLRYQGTEYTLKQFHFHSPGEHAIANGLGAGELHMVHKSADNKLLVLGVIMNSNGLAIGGGNVMLQKFWDAAHDGHEEIANLQSVTSMCGANPTVSASPSSNVMTVSSIFGISANDAVYDAHNTPCITPGTTVVSINNNQVTLSNSFSCPNGRPITFTSQNTPITGTCNPAAVLQGRENQIQSSTGVFATDMCKFSLEYETDHQPKVNPYAEFLPASKTFYTYSGSLTTYPCTEGVTWIVFEQPVTVSSGDIANLVATTACERHRLTMTQQIKSAKYFYADNRPLQALNSRTIYKYVDTSYTTSTSEIMDDKHPPLSIAAIVVGSIALAFTFGLIIKNMMEPKKDSNGLELTKKLKGVIPVPTVEA